MDKEMPSEPSAVNFETVHGKSEGFEVVTLVGVRWLGCGVCESGLEEKDGGSKASCNRSEKDTEMY